MRLHKRTATGRREIPAALRIDLAFLMGAK
jgi:hypothetical protein